MRTLRFACSASLVALAVFTLAPAPASARKCPNVMFVVDKSGSMAQNPDGGGNPPTKWDLTRQAVASAVDKYGNRIPFGLTMFSSDGNNAQQCYMDATVQVPVGHKTAGAIRQIIFATPPKGGTNTGEGIHRAVAEGGLDDLTRGNYIVLITDGNPNCNPGDGGQPPVPKYTLSEITAAATRCQDPKNPCKDPLPPVHTFVVGFDNSGGVDPVNLNNMAIAGLEPKEGCNPNVKGMPCYYSASSTSAFQQAMTEIVAGLQSTSVIGGCDDSCFGNGCPPNQICKYPALNQDPVCVPDPCLNVNCGDGTYCREGTCVAVCPPCQAGFFCVNGTCQPDKCDGASWNDNLQYCDPVTMGVQPTKCTMNLNCPLPTYCDPATGACADDPCRTINCPAKTTCNSAGYCETDAPDLPDMATAESADLGETGGPVITPVKGCQMGGHAPLTALLPLIALLGLVGLRRRR
jgi:MYXO-CTERM domain-containing protein